MPDRPRRRIRRPLRSLVALLTVAATAALGLFVATPAQAAVEIDSSSVSSYCYFGAIRPIAGVNGWLKEDESVEITFYVDGQLYGDPYRQTSGGFSIGFGGPFLQDDAEHTAELAVDGDIVASSTFSYLSECNPQPIAATVTFGEPVCVDASANATVDIDLSQGVSPEFIVTAESSAGTQTYSDYPHDEMGSVHFDIPLSAEDTTTVSVTERYRPTLTAPVADHTYVLPADCPSAPTPDPEPSSSPTPTDGPTLAPTDVMASVSDSTVTPGASDTVTASGFAPNEPVEILLHSEPVTLWSGVASASGTIQQTIVIPADTPLGDHRIEVRGATSGSAWVPITVSGGLARTGELAATGGDYDVLPYLLGGSGLVLAVGLAAILTTRRRRGNVR